MDQEVTRETTVTKKGKGRGNALLKQTASFISRYHTALMIAVIALLLLAVMLINAESKFLGYSSILVATLVMCALVFDNLSSGSKNKI